MFIFLKKKKLFFLTGLIVFVLIFSFFVFKRISLEDIIPKADLKMGFVTDWEYSKVKTGGDKKGELAEKYLTEAVKYFNHKLKPDIVIGGGDYVFGSKTEKEDLLEQFKKIISIFEKNRSEKAYLIGQRDLKRLERSDVLGALGVKRGYYKKEVKGFNILVLDTTGNEIDNKNLGLGEIDQEQFNWLKDELEKTVLPVIIFSHNSIIETPQDDFWRDNLLNEKKVLELLKNNNDKILAVFSGNNAEDYVTKEGGIPFVVAGGLTSEKSLGRHIDIRVNKKEDEFQVNIISLGENGSNCEIKRDLNKKTATRISCEQFKESNENSKEKKQWTDVEDENNKHGIISGGAGGEVAIEVTDSGKIITAFEDDVNNDYIHVRLFDGKKWIDLADENHPKGLISLGKGGNPNIATRGEDVFVSFMEYDFGYRARALKWSKGKWENLSDDNGFVSTTRGHEPELAFDKDENFLYIAYAEGVSGDNIEDPDPENKKTRIIVKKWNGNEWEKVINKGDGYVSERVAFEVDIISSKLDNSIYIAYEELNNLKHQIKIQKWNGEKWNDLSQGVFYNNKIKPLEGFSPSIALNSQDVLYLTFIEKSEGAVRIFQHNIDKKEWDFLGDGVVSSGRNKEAFVAVSDKDDIFSGYSNYKKGVVMEKEDEKGEIDLIKSGAWRVRLKKWENTEWVACEDDANHGGYISEGNGKGDPSAVFYGENLYVIFSDENNGYGARVKKFNFK